jgi:isoamylase
MLWMGDEHGHTRLGNNNPWCQDNELNWFDWNLVHANPGLVRFTKELIRFVKSVELLQDNRFWMASNSVTRGDISWHGIKAGLPDWTSTSRVLAFTLEHPSTGRHVHAMLNAGDRNLDFELPARSGGRGWVRIIDTSRPSPEDIVDTTGRAPVATGGILVPAHSTTVLVGQDKPLK